MVECEEQIKQSLVTDSAVEDAGLVTPVHSSELSRGSVLRAE